MIESTKESREKLRSTNGEEATEVVLKTLPNFMRGVYATSFAIVEPFQKKKIWTNMSCAAQILNMNEPKVHCEQLSKNYQMHNGVARKEYHKGNQVEVSNETDVNVQINKGDLIAYMTKAEEAIITKNDSECGRKYCKNKHEENNGEKIKLDKHFVTNITKKIQENLQDEADRDITYWKKKLKTTLQKLQDDDLISRETKNNIWNESDSYSCGYVANKINEWEATIKRK